VYLSKGNPYERHTRAIPVERAALERCIKPAKLIVQRKANLSAHGEDESGEVQQAVQASIDLLELIYKDLEATAISRQYKPGWVYYRMRDAESRIQQFWSPLGLYQSIEFEASVYSSKYESKAFPEKHKAAQMLRAFENL